MPLDELAHTSILSHAMLATLSISVFSGQRIDRKATNEVAENHGTVASDTGRFSKNIISKHSLEPIQKLAGVARTTHYEHTLPWSDIGPRLLSAKGFRTYAARMAELREKFEKEVDDFIRVYPTLIEQARTRLNTLFDEADYPTVSGMRARFEFAYHFSPLPDAGNWFIDGIGDEMRELRSSVNDHVDQRVREAVRDVWSRVADHTKHIHDRLTNYSVNPETGKVEGSVFRDSLIGNLKDLVELLPSLNVTNDPELDTIVADLRGITRYSAAALRADKDFRVDAAKRAKAVFDKAALILG